jgi:hypothetical protein
VALSKSFDAADKTPALPFFVASRLCVPITGKGLGKDVATITHGRFSGGSHGFVAGHATPDGSAHVTDFKAFAVVVRHYLRSPLVLDDELDELARNYRELCRLKGEDAPSEHELEDLRRSSRSQAADQFLIVLKTGGTFAPAAGPSEAILVDCLRQCGRGRKP